MNAHVSLDFWQYDTPYWQKRSSLSSLNDAFFCCCFFLGGPQNLELTLRSTKLFVFEADLLYQTLIRIILHIGRGGAHANMFQISNSS